MFINIRAFNEDYALENGLSINDVALIGYLVYISKEKGLEFKYSYSDIFKEVPIVFNCKTQNANYKKVNKILSTPGVENFVKKVSKRNGTKGIEITFKLNKNEIKKLEVENMFTKER